MNSSYQPCLFNLILYAKEEHIDTYLTSVVKHISDTYPCRIILLTEGRTSRTFSPDLHILPMNFSQKNDLPLLLFPLLKSDLPTYLLFAEDPLTFSLPGMENYLSKIIFDSNASTDLVSFAKAAISCPYPFADLGWNRIEQWQGLFAEQFNRKDKLSLIEHAKRVKIFYKGNSPIQAIYLQAWIALKLGWKNLSFDKEYIQYSHLHNAIDVLLIPEEDSILSEGRILAVSVDAEEYGQMQFTRDPQRPQIATIEQIFPTYCEMPGSYFFDEERFGRSLSMEVCRHFTHKSLYFVLSEIAKYPEGALCH